MLRFFCRGAIRCIDFARYSVNNGPLSLVTSFILGIILKTNIWIYLSVIFSVTFISSYPLLSHALESNLASKSITKKQIHAFADVVNVTRDLTAQYGADQVLIVMDIDNTILTSTTDLGSDVWYQWQTDKLDVKPSPAQKVACLYQDAIGLLYELSPMQLTEPDLYQTISNWQVAGHTVTALTSRAPVYRAATERELIRNKVNLATNALLPVEQDDFMFREMKGREISYMQGVMMTSGMNKGEMLQYLLNKTHRHFAAIVFVDDSKKNIDNMYKAYQNTKNVDMRIFHYTRIEDQRKKQFGQVLTQSQADKMAQQWQQLNSALQQIFPARRLAKGCLTL